MNNPCHHSLRPISIGPIPMPSVGERIALPTICIRCGERVTLTLVNSKPANEAHDAKRGGT